MVLSSFKQSLCFAVYCLVSFTGSSSHQRMLRPTLFASAFSFSRISAKATNSCRNRAFTMSATAATSTAATLEEHSTAYKSLLEKLRTVTHLNRASAVLNYDRQVFMPHADRSSAQRGKQLAVLATIAHEKATDKEIGELLEKATKDFEEWSANAEGKEEAVKTAKRILELESNSYKKSTCIPSELAARKAELEASAYSSWVKARENNDFVSFAPDLKACFDLAKEVAALQRTDENVSLYSQMLDEFEMGMEASRIDELFDQVKDALVPLIAKIRASETKPAVDALSGKFNVDSQKEACQKIVTQLGFDETHGRIDVSVHPFTMSLSQADVRITSRFKDSEWLQGLMGTIHEGGHAMYEQALGDSDLSLDSALSMGVHESQSLFWERHVGLSKGFWIYARDILKNSFEKDGETKFDYSSEDLYGAVNAVNFENLIRVEADELTYPLHVILRYNIERDVVAGKIDVNDVPARWNSDMKTMLDVDVPNDTQGALQDIHWSCLAIGYFPTYLLGSMMAAQLSHYCHKDIPDMDKMIEEGKFEDIRNWLTDKVHRHGKRYKSLDELLVDQVGEPLNAKYFIDYLGEKYGELYNVA